jgi:hypothetical protein
MAIFRDIYKVSDLVEQGDAYFAPIPLEEGAKSTVRTGFDPAKHAAQLMKHELWYKNHYSYGVKAAQKRKDKGTYDPELGKKAGYNLSKIGDFQLGTKLNAAEHRAVGEHIAKHIENDIGLKEGVEQDEISSGTKTGTSTKEYLKASSPATGRFDLSRIKEATDEENYHTDETFSRRATPAEKAAGARRNAGHAHIAKLKQVTRVNKGTYGTAVIDHEDEHHAGAPDVNPTYAGANAAMKAFGLTVRTSNASGKTVSQGVTTKQTTKASPARQALTQALKGAKTAAEKARIRAQYRKMNEEVELDEGQIKSLNKKKKAEIDITVGQNWKNKWGKETSGKTAQQIGRGINKYGGSALYKKMAEEIELDESDLSRVKYSANTVSGTKTGTHWKAEMKASKRVSKASKKVRDSSDEGTKKHWAEKLRKGLAAQADAREKNKDSVYWKDKFAVTKPSVKQALQAQKVSEEVELDERFDGDAALANDNYSHPSDNRVVTQKKVRKIAVMDPTQIHVRSYDETPEGMAKAKAHAVKLGGTVKRVTEDTEFELDIVKEGSIYSYQLSLDDEIIKEGIGITESGIINDTIRLLQNSIVEEQGFDSFKYTINRYTK